ncbi:hypothetical protein LguiA_022809 [Lonicera macranthoides]
MEGDAPFCFCGIPSAGCAQREVWENGRTMMITVGIFCVVFVRLPLLASIAIEVFLLDQILNAPRATPAGYLECLETLVFKLGTISLLCARIGGTGGSGWCPGLDPSAGGHNNWYQRRWWIYELVKQYR